MHKALIYASRQGPFKKEITAFDIKSREHYRDLLPLLCPETGKPVTWVKGNFEDRKVIRRSHFRLLAGKRRSDYLNYTEYKKSRNASIQTPEHIKAKEVLSVNNIFAAKIILTLIKNRCQKFLQLHLQTPSHIITF